MLMATRDERSAACRPGVFYQTNLPINVIVRFAAELRLNQPNWLEATSAPCEFRVLNHGEFVASYASALSSNRSRSVIAVFFERPISTLINGLNRTSGNRVGHVRYVYCRLGADLGNKDVSNA
jgi:hypothetical protein